MADSASRKFSDLAATPFREVNAGSGTDLARAILLSEIRVEAHRRLVAGLNLSEPGAVIVEYDNGVKPLGTPRNGNPGDMVQEMMDHLEARRLGANDRLISWGLSNDTGNMGELKLTRGNLSAADFNRQVTVVQQLCQSMRGLAHGLFETGGLDMLAMNPAERNEAATKAFLTRQVATAVDQYQRGLAEAAGGSSKTSLLGIAYREGVAQAGMTGQKVDSVASVVGTMLQDIAAPAATQGARLRNNDARP